MPLPDLHQRLAAQADHLTEVIGTLPASTLPQDTLHEPLGSGLNNLFLLRVTGIQYLGRRPLGADGKPGSRLSADMLLGKLLSHQWDLDGWKCHYQPITERDCRKLFREALESPDNRIHFPFPELDANCHELIAPNAYWDNPGLLAADLDRQEAHFREAAIRLLEQRLPATALIHDPACSTGTFIAALARAFPASHCVGTDRSSAMVRHAKHHHRLANLHFASADAHQPLLEQASCNVLVLRFLNAEMMPRQVARSLFHQLVGLVEKRGLMLIFGQSSLLLDIEQEVRHSDLRVVQSLAGVPGSSELFQFYLLERNAT